MINITKTQWRIIYEGVHETFFKNADYITSDFLNQCKHNPNVKQFIFNEINNNIKEIDLEVILYLQVVMIRRYIMNTKVIKEAFVEDKDQKNESATNYQNEDENYMDSALFKDKEKRRPSKTNEEKKGKKP